MRIDFSCREVVSCHCFTLPQILVSLGFFPASPREPRMAISIDLLNFFHALWDRSGDAVHALASALKDFYFQRGFIFRNAMVGIFLSF